MSKKKKLCAPLVVIPLILTQIRKKTSLYLFWFLFALSKAIRYKSLARTFEECVCLVSTAKPQGFSFRGVQLKALSRFSGGAFESFQFKYLIAHASEIQLICRLNIISWIVSCDTQIIVVNCCRRT